MAKSRQLIEAIELRDRIADAILDYESRNKGHRVVLRQEYVLDDSPARAKLGILGVEIVATDGSHKATEDRQLHRSI